MFKTHIQAMVHQEISVRRTNENSLKRLLKTELTFIGIAQNEFDFPPHDKRHVKSGRERNRC